MKNQDIRAMSDEELLSELRDMEDGMARLKLDHAVKGLENPLEMRSSRRAIAQLKTEARSRELVAGGEALLAKRSKIRARRKLNRK